MNAHRLVRARMKRLTALAFCFSALVFSLPAAFAQTDSAAGATPSADAALKTQAAAAVASGQAEARAPHFLEHLVDEVLKLFNVRTSGNSMTHYAIAALLLIIALLGRRIAIHLVFPFFRRLATRTRSNLDDRLFAALEAPIAAFIMLLGVFGALRVLKLTETADQAIGYGSRVAFSLAVFWGVWRAIAAVLEQATENARQRGSTLTTFMPWIKKSLLTILLVFAVLLTIQSLGYDVKAILAGLGIGGLAFALAAQDTLANVFGAIVVAVDQPFKHGEVVKIQGNVGAIEDVGIRSTRIRLGDGSLVIIPNKIVAGETITNLSRFIKRRFELIVPLPYDTKPEHVQELVAEIRAFISSQPEVNGPGVLCFFRGFTPNHLEIWSVYECPSPDFIKAMNASQRINFFVMNALAARGISAPAPVQRIQLEGEALDRMAARETPPTV